MTAHGFEWLRREWNLDYKVPVYEEILPSSLIAKSRIRELLAALASPCCVTADLEQVKEALVWLVGDESLLAGLMEPSVVATLGPDVRFRAARARDIGEAALALLGSQTEKEEHTDG